MAKLPEKVDMLIIGAGTAGAACAQLAAERGLDTLCIDRGSLDAAGARWVNGVPEQAFVDAGVGVPEAPELRENKNSTYHLVAGWGPERVTMQHHGLLDVDMCRLVARLQRQAREAGAQLRGGVSFDGLMGTSATTSAGTVRADVVVDASGEGGAALLGRDKTASVDLCAAAQHVHTVADRDEAQAFFAKHGTKPGDTLCFSAIAGGYSILNLRMHGDEIDILTGSIPGRGHVSGGKLLDDFVRDQRWIGKRVFGGRRVIPLGRPRDTIARGQVALIGDAARQVFSAHGSGIGAGMIAARLLVEAVTNGSGPETYAMRWQRTRGGVLAAADLFRRFSESLDEHTLTFMMKERLMDEHMLAAALAQRIPRVPLRAAPAKIAALGKHPRLAGTIGKLGVGMAAMQALYAAYPASASRRPRWSAAVERTTRAATPSWPAAA